MTIVIRSEKSVATRARPKIDGLLSDFSLIPSYRYSPPRRDRTRFNHDRLNVIIFSLVEVLENQERRFYVNVLLAEGSKGSCEGRSLTLVMRTRDDGRNDYVKVLDEMQKMEDRRAAGVKKGSVGGTQPMKPIRIYFGKQERSRGRGRGT